MKALTVIKRALAKHKRDVVFVSIVYTAKARGSRLTDEKARHVLELRKSIRQVYEEDVAILTHLMPTFKGIELEAAQEILAAKRKALRKGFTDRNTYTYVKGAPGLKIHKATGAVHIIALAHDKKVIGKHSLWKKSNHGEMALAKMRIGDLLPSANIRQFKVSEIEQARVVNNTMVLR